MRILEFMIVAALVPGFALSATGCSTQQMPEAGYSVRQAVAMQTLNPEAGGTEPVTGLDGKYAATAMDNYQKLPKPADESKSMSLGSLFKVGEGK